MLIITGQAMAKSGLMLLARIVGYSATPITQASLSSIDYAIRDLTSATTITTGTLTISAVVYDTLQTDAVWDRDDDGYNFRWIVPAANLQNGGHRYRIDVRFNPASGESFVQPWEFELTPAYVS